MRRGARLAVVAVIGVMAGCSGPKPPVQTQEQMTREQAYKKLAELEKQLENRKPVDLKAADDLYAQLQREKAMKNRPQGSPPPAASEPAVQPAPARPAPLQAPPVGSEDEFTELVRKAGYEPHAKEKGYLPYFDVAKDDQSAHGLPGKLRIVYVLSDDKQTLYFLGVVRALRQNELPSLDMSDPFHTHEPSDDDYAKPLIARLQAANPVYKDSRFLVRQLPAGLQQLPEGVMGGGDAVLMQATVVLNANFKNISADPQVIETAVAIMEMVLPQTQNLWK